MQEQLPLVQQILQYVGFVADVLWKLAIFVVLPLAWWELHRIVNTKVPSKAKKKEVV